MRQQLLRSCLCLLVACCAVPLVAEEPAIPEKIMAPAGVELLYSGEAKGKQIYVGKLNDKNVLVWQLEGPKAEVVVAGATWTHFAGPAWQAPDGSRVIKVTEDGSLKSADAPNAADIPWLLIKVQADGDKTGVLSKVTYVQRINTKGGKPGALPTKVGDRVEVDYTATYRFFGTK